MELFDIADLRAAEQRRAIDAAQIPGQVDIFEAIADVEAELVEVAPVMPAPRYELLTTGEARGQMVLV